MRFHSVRTCYVWAATLARIPRSAPPQLPRCGRAGPSYNSLEPVARTGQPE